VDLFQSGGGVFCRKRRIPRRPQALPEKPPAPETAGFCALWRNTPITAIISVTRRAQSACFARFERGKPLFAMRRGDQRRFWPESPAKAKKEAP